MGMTLEDLVDILLFRKGPIRENQVPRKRDDPLITNCLRVEPSRAESYLGRITIDNKVICQRWRETVEARPIKRDEFPGVAQHLLGEQTNDKNTR